MHYYDYRAKSVNFVKSELQKWVVVSSWSSLSSLGLVF